jgi:hypothetical protein
MPSIFNAGTHTTSRAESVNAQIKQRLDASSKLTEIFHEMNALTERVVTNQKVWLRNQQKLFVNHPLLADLNELYSRHAFETMLH